MQQVHPSRFHWSPGTSRPGWCSRPASSLRCFYRAPFHAAPSTTVPAFLQAAQAPGCGREWGSRLRG
jgi:hypothetical protein